MAVALGEDEVGVVEQPVDGRGGERLGHDRVEAIWGWLIFVQVMLPLVPGQNGCRFAY